VTKSQPISAPAHSSRQPAGFSSSNLFLSLQHALGNQGMLQLFESKAIQAKMRVSQPGDADELEADRVADHVVAATHAPHIHRKCACEGSSSSCPKYEEEATGTTHRGVASQILRSTHFSVQRAPAGSAPTNTPDQVGNPPQPSPTPAHPHPLVVEDDAKSVAPHQMRKSAFIALLRTDACAAADAVLASVGHTTKSCPYIEKWLGFYEKQSSDHIERAILKYAPETVAARNAHEAIRLVVLRVQRAAMTWAKTGKVAGLPEDLASQLPGQGFLGAVHRFASSSVGGAVLGFLGGSKPEKSAPDAPASDSPASTLSRKATDAGAGPAPAPAHDAAAVRSQLGAGHSLDSRVQSQMSNAFGYDFSAVRVHTDSQASSLSTQLNARAFTVGRDVAFGAGEYNPGTPLGDALLAHELAHVVQQGGGDRTSPVPLAKGADETRHLESDAETSAAHAAGGIWAGTRNHLAHVGANAIPRLRSGLQLQRCSKQAQVKSPATAAPTCTTVDAATWRTQVKNAHDLSATDTDHATAAMFSLVQQALCPIGIRVHMAGTSNPVAEDPRDYAESQTGNVINFDPKLNTKTRWGGYNKDRSLKAGDVLGANAGHNFAHGPRGWAVLGPQALDESTPIWTRQYAQHELFMLARNLTPGISETRADTEIATWTHDFVTHFHEWAQEFPKGPRPRWQRFIEYYEDPENRGNSVTKNAGPVTQPARDAAIASLAAYYRNPPVPKEKRDEFNRAFTAWMNKEHGRLLDDLDSVLHLRTTRPNP